MTEYRDALYDPRKTPSDELRADWEKLIEAQRKIPSNDRDIDEIASEYGLTLSQFFGIIKDKAVLDAGAGNSSLKWDAASLHLDSEIISLDMDKLELQMKPGANVAGKLEQLPFRDESFDVVLATYSLPLWAKSTHQAKAFLDESLRVLKPDGKLMVAPLISTMARPAIHPTEGVIEHPIFDYPFEMNPRIQNALRDIEIGTMDWLIALRDDERYDIQLGVIPEDLTSELPQSVTVTKR